MKYCINCGSALPDDAEFCTACGCKFGESYHQSHQNDKPIKGSGLGFVLSFFLGLVGFLLAIFLGDEECKKTATTTFIICTAVTVVLVIAIVAVTCSAFAFVPSYY